jgi:hypothetical protein
VVLGNLYGHGAISVVLVSLNSFAVNLLIAKLVNLGFYGHSAISVVLVSGFVE